MAWRLRDRQPPCCRWGGRGAGTPRREAPPAGGLRAALRPGPAMASGISEACKRCRNSPTGEHCRSKSPVLPWPRVAPAGSWLLTARPTRSHRVVHHFIDFCKPPQPASNLPIADARWLQASQQQTASRATPGTRRGCRSLRAPRRQRHGERLPPLPPAAAAAAAAGHHCCPFCLALQACGSSSSGRGGQQQQQQQQPWRRRSSGTCGRRTPTTPSSSSVRPAAACLPPAARRSPLAACTPRPAAALLRSRCGAAPGCRCACSALVSGRPLAAPGCGPQTCRSAACRQGASRWSCLPTSAPRPPRTSASCAPGSSGAGGLRTDVRLWPEGPGAGAGRRCRGEAPPAGLSSPHRLRSVLPLLPGATCSPRATRTAPSTASSAAS